jgi:cysteinyl-tRNA synthetase
MRQAASALERFIIFFARSDNDLKKRGIAEKAMDDRVKSDIDALKSCFIAAMDDDFNTPQALGRLFEIMTLSNSRSAGDCHCLAYAAKVIKDLASIFNLTFETPIGIDKDLEAYVKVMIEKRNSHRARGDFQSADIIRDELRAKGIIIEDGKGITSWRKQ